MYRAKDFFGDSIAELNAWLKQNANQKPARGSADLKVRLVREQRGACTVLSFTGSGHMPWPDKARAAIRE